MLHLINVHDVRKEQHKITVILYLMTISDFGSVVVAVLACLSKHRMSVLISQGVYLKTEVSIIDSHRILLFHIRYFLYVFGPPPASH